MKRNTSISDNTGTLSNDINSGTYEGAEECGREAGASEDGAAASGWEVCGAAVPESSGRSRVEASWVVSSISERVPPAM